MHYSNILRVGLVLVVVGCVVVSSNALLLDGEPDSVIMQQLESLRNMTADLNARLAMETELRVQLSARFTEMETLQHKCDCQGTAYPAFMADLSSDLSQCTANQAVVFDDVKTNQGGAYNGEHGIFTAPVAGMYVFSGTLSARPEQGFRTGFVKNAASNIIGYIHGLQLDTWLQRSTTVVVHLDVNDEVWMVCLGNNSHIAGDAENELTANDFHSHMSGFLVSPDPSN